MPSAYYLPKNIKLIGEGGNFQREKYCYFFKKCEEIWKEQLKKNVILTITMVYTKSQENNFPC